MAARASAARPRPRAPGAPDRARARSRCPAWAGRRAARRARRTARRRRSPTAGPLPRAGVDLERGARVVVETADESRVEDVTEQQYGGGGGGLCLYIYSSTTTSLLPRLMHDITGSSTKTLYQRSSTEVDQTVVAVFLKPSSIWLRNIMMAHRCSKTRATAGGREVRGCENLDRGIPERRPPAGGSYG